jgi:ABC-type multidrug transport system fused ATPase/permease subunit
MTGGVRPTSGLVRVTDQRIGVVYQESFLFSGNVRDNVTMGRLDIDDEAVWNALRVAALDEFVRTLPRSLDTEVGERGVSLSGGQRQRLALARAVARDSSILAIDDTTSALDPATESVVLQRLAALEPPTTIVLVATRPSAIAIADVVFYIEGGQVVDTGTPEDLLQRNQRYRELISSYATDRSHTEPPGDQG